VLLTKVLIKNSFEAYIKEFLICPNKKGLGENAKIQVGKKKFVKKVS